MGKTPYILRYLPLFYDDLEEMVMYIANVLCNRDAAEDLLGPWLGLSHSL